MTRVAGIDYNLSQLDVAIVDGLEIIDVRTVDMGQTRAAQVNSMALVADQLRQADVETVVMEQPWQAVGFGLAAAMRLHVIPISMETLAVFAGLKVQFVPVSTWRRVVLGKGNLKKAEAKELARAFVAQAFERTLARADTAEAVCLAHYGASLFAQTPVTRKRRRRVRL